MKKESTHKRAERQGTREIVFRGLDCDMMPDGRLVVRMPAIQIDRPDIRMVTEEICDWSRDQGISEPVFIRAVEEMEHAFYSELEKQQIMEVLQDHIER